MNKQDAVEKVEQQVEQATETEKEKDCNAAKQPQVETPGDAQLKKLQEQFEQSVADLVKQKDPLLHTVAEYNNYRKRIEHEKIMAYTDATVDTTEKVLPVCDDLEHALTQQGGTVEDSRKGVEVVLTQPNGTLEKMSVTATGQQGESLDPKVHNAVSYTEDENLGENVVAEVLQEGYCAGDCTIRHAMVQVANRRSGQRNPPRFNGGCRIGSA